MAPTERDTRRLGGGARSEAGSRLQCSLGARSLSRSLRPRTMLCTAALAEAVEPRKAQRHKGNASPPQTQEPWATRPLPRHCPPHSAAAVQQEPLAGRATGRAPPCVTRLRPPRPCPQLTWCALSNTAMAVPHAAYVRFPSEARARMALGSSGPANTRCSFEHWERGRRGRDGARGRVSSDRVHSPLVVLSALSN